MESLAAKQGAPEEELTAPPEERARAEAEAPSWLEELSAEETEARAEETPQAMPEAEAKPTTEAEGLAVGEEEAHEWVQELEAEEVTTPAAEEQTSAPPGEAVAEPEEGPAEAAAPVPEWLRQPEEAPEMETPAEAEGEIPSWLMDTEEAPEPKEMVKGTESVAEAAHQEAEEGWLTSEAREALEAEAASMETLPEWLAEVAEEPSQTEGEEGAATAVEHLRGEWVPEEALRAPASAEAEAAPIPEEPSPPPSETAPTKPKDRYEEWLAQARAALQQGDLPEALKMYQRLIKKGKHLEAIIQDIEEALYRFPVEVDLLQTLGDAYLRADRLQEALDMYTKAEELLR